MSDEDEEDISVSVAWSGRYEGLKDSLQHCVHFIRFQYMPYRLSKIKMYSRE